MCFAPQPRGILEHLNFKNGSGNVVFCTFWLSNVLFATAACHFSPVRRTATSAPAALASLLFEHQEPRFIEKTQRFATSLTFFAHVELLASDSTRMLIFLLVTWLMLIFLLVTWLLCDSAFQLYILSEVRLLNFLRSSVYMVYWIDFTWLAFNYGKEVIHLGKYTMDPVGSNVRTKYIVMEYKQQWFHTCLIFYPSNRPSKYIYMVLWEHPKIYHTSGS